MSGTLDAIVARKRGELAARRAALPADAVRHPDPRGFARALARAPGEGAVAVIAEVKRKSPSGGAFPHADLVAVARGYARAGAAAISVLTDGGDFGGSLADLVAVRAAVAVPVLRKDFLLEPAEVFEAAAAGADAVLLIAEVLDADALRAMLAACAAAGLDALVEAHDRAHAERAVAAGARVVGVNNRDLGTLATDTRTALDLVPALRARCDVLVAESGLKTPADLAAARAAGADAVLVGESLLRAPDPGAALRALRGEHGA